MRAFLLFLCLPAIALAGEPDRRLFDLPDAAWKATTAAHTSAAAKPLGIKTRRVRFPSAVRTATARNNTVHGIYFEPSKPTDRAVVFLPWFKDGDTKKAEMICATLAASGLRVLFIAMGYQFERAPEGRGSGSAIMEGSAAHLQEWVRQAVVDTRRARQWLVREKHAHADKVGVMGVSLGGFVAALTYGVAPEFKAAAVLLAGGKLGSLVKLGADLGIKQITEPLARMKIDPADLPELLRAYDPISYAEPSRKGGLFLVNGLLDPIVPFPLGHALWKAWGKPKKLWLPAGHVTAVAFSPLILSRATKHLRGALK